jgi:hypothetical protein
MRKSEHIDFNRRQFLKTAGSAAAIGMTAGAAAQGVSLVIDPADSIASAAPAQWAAKELEHSLWVQGVAVHRCERLSDAKAGDLCILAAGSNFPAAQGILKRAGVSVAKAPQALGLVPGKAAGKSVLLACGYDSLGLVYGLLDLADRVQHGAGPAALPVRKPIVEHPANAVRSVARLFVSDVEDKPWYNDRDMWPRYLTLLAAQRFNRFNLSFGIGYDFLRNVTDAYLLFSYPFLLQVPGYNVRAAGLPDAERDRNLEMLKFISEQTVARGLQFQLGLWMHGYEWIDSPKPNYTIEGLTRETHGPYCRDAVRALLKACPAISGVTFRVHGESGVEEGSYDFWKTVFEGVTTCGRKVEIDMHSKGMDQTMLDLAANSGMPIKLSPKFWAEHMGMTYHQADIREFEQPKAGREATGLMKFSAGSRSFLRYGYGDLLREDRRWGVLHRIWPGTQRLLLWGDPLTAAAYSRAFSFCGSDGVEICEPLSFKGRRGSGIAGDRCAYADASLKPRWDWQKYEYSHRVWGRMLYNPDSGPDASRRYLQKHFGAGAEAAETALANSSRILPIITTAHGASAANNTYWPEVYLNQSILDGDHPGPYRDTPAPRVFGNVSPFDPQLFSRINDFADQLIKGERDGKYSPIEAAQWIEDYAAAALKNLGRLEAQPGPKDRPEYRRLVIDVAIEAGLGHFFGAKFRSGVLYRIYEQSGNRAALEGSLKAYRAARSAWAELADRAKGVYVSDITVGENPQLRGHWLDRLPAIDEDIARMSKRLEQSKAGDAPSERAQMAIKETLGRPRRPAFSCHHTPPAKFHPGRPLEIELSVEKVGKPVSVRVYYRHVNQAERYESAEMQAQDSRYRATLPGSYTDSNYPLQYYFELKPAPDIATLYPGFTADLTNQPYFVVRRG